MTDNPHECPSSEYEQAKQELMQGALDAEDTFDQDELEDYLRNLRRQHE